MTERPYNTAAEAREAVDAAFRAAWEPTIDHNELLLAIRTIVSKAYRSGVEHGVVLADHGTVCENHLELSDDDRWVLDRATEEQRG